MLRRKGGAAPRSRGGSPNVAVAWHSRDADVILTDTRCSRGQFRIVRRGDDFTLELLSPTCQTLGGCSVARPVPFMPGDVLSRYPRTASSMSARRSRPYQ